MKTYDKMLLEVDPPEEGVLCSYVPEDGNNEFYFVLVDGEFKCSVDEEFEDFWMLDDLESDNPL